jgi:DNA-binding transcriptional LysR family regulator
MIHDYKVMFDTLLSERGLSLDRLHVLLKIHEAGSIAAAAPGDSVRQSQYSRQLRELSEYFGCEVARRQGKLLKLTPQGVQLADLVRQHFRSLSDFRAQCRSEAVDYTIAAGDSLIHWLIIPRLGGLPQGLGPHNFATLNLRTKEIIQQLIDSRVDFAVARSDALPDEFERLPLGTLEFCALIPRRLVREKRRATLQVLFGGVPMAAQNTDGQFSGKLREIAALFVQDFRPALSCQSFPQVLSAVRSEAYAAVLPRIAVGDLPSGLCHRIEGGALGPLSRELVLAFHPRLVSLRPKAAVLAKVLQTGLRF